MSHRLFEVLSEWPGSYDVCCVIIEDERRCLNAMYSLRDCVCLYQPRLPLLCLMHPSFCGLPIAVAWCDRVSITHWSGWSTLCILRLYKHWRVVLCCAASLCTHFGHQGSLDDAMRSWRICSSVRMHRCYVDSAWSYTWRLPFLSLRSYWCCLFRTSSRASGHSCRMGLFCRPPLDSLLLHPSYLVDESQ